MIFPSVAICTLFRDCEVDVHRSFLERSKWEYPQDKLLHICIEGDSIDGTYDTLNSYKTKYRTIVEKLDNGHVKFGSVAESERLKILSKLWNLAFSYAESENVDFIFVLDSDISMSSTVLQQLINHNKDVIAPMMFFENSVYFRDTWAYRGINGECFVNRPPYHKDYKRPHPFQVNSVGLPLLKQEVLKKGAKCGDNEVVSLCDKIRDLGFQLFVDPLAITYHPRGDIEIPLPYEHK